MTRAHDTKALQIERLREADELLQQGYPALKSKVREDVRVNLRGRNLELQYIDFDGCYNAAWFGLHRKVLDGEHVESVVGWLVNAIVWAALDETELAVRRPEVSTEVVQAEQGTTQLDFADVHLSRTVIRNWITGLRTRLSEREQQAAALHVFHGYTRDEIATMLNVERIRVDKILNSIYHKTRPLLQSLSDGTFCEEQRSLMTAYACGVLDPEGERYAIARKHLLECPGCAALVRAQRGLSALIPAPMLITTLAASGSGLLGAIIGFFKGSGAGAASTGVTSAGAGTTGGMIAFGGAAKMVVVPVVCALCVGGALELGRSPDAKPASPPAVAAQQHSRPQVALSVPTITAAARAHDPAPTPRARQTAPVARTTTKQAGSQPAGTGGEFSIERSAPAPAPTTSSATTSATTTSQPPPSASQGGEFGIER